MQKKMIVHIGYPKTATTWMQKYLFIKDHGFHVIPRDYLISVLDKNDILDKHYYKENILYKINKFIDNCPDHLVPIATWEGFALNMYDKDVEGYYKRTARQISNHFPNAKILISIREQYSMLSSLYNQALDSFLIQVDFPSYLKCKTPYFQSLAALDYHELIAHYQKVFKPENVLVWPHETFCRTPGTILTQIKKLTGADIRIKRLDTEKKLLAKDGKYFAYHTTRHLAPLLKNMDLFLSPIQRKKGISAFKITQVADFIRSHIASFVPEGMERKHKQWRASTTMDIIGRYYAKSNEKTSSLTDLNLSQYGYELSSRQRVNN